MAFEIKFYPPTEKPPGASDTVLFTASVCCFIAGIIFGVMIGLTFNPHS